MYTVGREYTRNDIYEHLNLPYSERGGDWLNGYHRHGTDYYVFCNVGVAGRTGHDYANRWDGSTLVWFGKTGSHFGQETIRNLASGRGRVFVFYRESDRAPFIFAGMGVPTPYPDTARPARIDWTFDVSDKGGSVVFALPDEDIAQSASTEGARVEVLVNRYERDRKARAACISAHGAICKVCGMDFGSVYGSHGEGFIHVHHVVPLSEIGHSYQVDPVKDLVPVCPNCHAMLHRGASVLSVEALKALLASMK